MKELADMVTDKRYRSRKWLGFLLITLCTFVLTIMGKDMGAWIQWTLVGYPAFVAGNTVLKWKGKEA